MANTLRVKRRTTGAVGAPAALKSGEIAYNMMDGILYIGFGDDGGGNATSIKAFAKDNFNASVTYQVNDPDLDALAALAATGFAVRTAANTWAQRSIAGTAGRITISNGDGVAGNPTLDLATVAVGAAVAGGSTKFTVDAYGRVTNAGQASLSDLSAPTADLSVGNFKLTNVATPTAGTDAANKSYVDNALQGLDAKASVRATTVSAIAATYNNGAGTLTATANGTIASASAIFDGVATLVVGDRVIVMNQASAFQNGIYTVTNAGAAGAPYVLTRATDADTWTELVSAYAFVEKGTANADKGFVCSVDEGGTLGTTSVTFVQFNGSGGGFAVAGAGLSANGSTVDVVAGAGITVAADTVALTGQALALHNVVTSADTLIYATGAGAFATATLTAFARSILDDADAATVRVTIGAQAQNARLDNLAALNITTADNVILYGAGNVAAAYTLGATGKSLMGAGTAAAAKATLGLGTMGDQAASAVAITGGTVSGIDLDGGTF
jgi:hypothetical protein